MEKKSNKGLVFLVVILLFTSLGLGGYIAYDKMIKKDASPKIETNNEEVVETKDTENEKEEQVQDVEKTRTAQILHGTPVLNGIKGGTIIVTKEGFVYFEPSETQKEAEGIEKIGTYGEYELEDYITGLGWDEVNQKLTEEHKFNGYKLNLDNVVSAYDVDEGNGNAYQNYLFTQEDGTVDLLAFGYVNGITKAVFEKNVSEHSNIVSVTQSAGFGADIIRFIDRDGNSYKFSAYKYFEN